MHIFPFAHALQARVSSVQAGVLERPSEAEANRAESMT